jgi:AcrR family transcriptional regulator
MSEAPGRDRVLECAIRLFAARGYEGTSTAGVAREAGVTQPLVHHHFGSKDGLWRAAVDHVFAEVPSLLARSSRPDDPQDALSQILARFVRLSAMRPEVARIVAREGAEPSPRLTYLLERHVGVAFREAVALIREAQRAGVIDRTLRAELVLLFALGAGSHIFDIRALVREGLGVDVTDPRIRESFVALYVAICARGALGPRAKM